MLFVVCGSSSTISPQRSAEECKALGFQREVARCSFCETLRLRTGNAQLHIECLSCCTTLNDKEEAEVVYTSAKIVSSRLQEVLSSPHSLVARFVQAYSGRPYFKKLTLEDRGWYNAPSELVLSSDSGEHQIVHIAAMEPHIIDELLTKKLGGSA